MGFLPLTGWSPRVSKPGDGHLLSCAVSCALVCSSVGFRPCLKPMCRRLSRVRRRSSTFISQHYLRLVCLQGLHGCVYLYDVQLMFVDDSVYIV